MRIAVAATVAICAADLAGWAFGISSLTYYNVELAAMVPTTAISILLLCGALIFSGRPKVTHTLAARPVMLVVPALVIVAANVVLASGGGLDGYLLGTDPGYRMSMATALCITYGASALLVWRVGRRNRIGVSVILVSAGLLTVLYAIIMQLADASLFHELPVFSAMSLPTALALSLLFSALLIVLGRERRASEESAPADYFDSLMLALPVLLSPVLFVYGWYAVRADRISSPQDKVLGLALIAAMASAALLHLMLYARHRR